MRNANFQNEQLEWEMRPGGMLLQRRDDESDHHHQDVATASRGHMIEINVAHGQAQYNVPVPAQSTFGELKRAIEEKTKLGPQQQKLLFRGKEREDSEHLHASGLKDKSKVLLLEELTNEEEKKPEDMEDSEEMRKALQSVAGVRAEIDKLSERVTALEVVVNSGTKVAVEEFDMSAELLMKELLKLDSIEAEGEARMQRKAEVRRVQKFHNTLDNLKAKNSNPFNDSSNAVKVTTQWETFDSGMGSLNPPPPMSSSTTINQDWEQFD
ncbi:BAG family molecular chaperone regulator 4 [Mangifera indica]|uniref:BAG family molecular chaperone regulator 4 n=1 Tax=Mangifera indica TaxID=29780 RepID=UPI001CFBF97D|nr:BAG family molecular chaperone regulator 4 [Mangifera indica]